ncbi:MAG: CRISPR-associated endonuclease Cas2 [Paracoccaceae bacterium]
MSRSEGLWIVSYDISDNKCRRRVASKLEDEMTRVQRSVFEGRLTEIRVNKLIKEISKMIAKGDNLRVYSISKVGERRCRVEGDGVPIERNAGYWLI